MKISAVVNTRNEESNIADCLESLSWVDELVVVDMESEDKSKDIAFRFTKNVYNHKFLPFVEPARNFGISKTTGDWILILDPDERIEKQLAQELIEIADSRKDINFVRIPRKNIVFGQWLKYSRWWPDHNVRFFRRGKVEWEDKIHRIPITHGNGLTLDPKEELALTHFHYNTITEYIDKLLRYTKVQAKELEEEGYDFDWKDLIRKPLSEFLSRFFAGQGYKDGLHGLVLSGLQAFSEYLVYLRVWESQGFKSKKGKTFELDFISLLKEKGHEISYWVYTLKLDYATKKTQRFILKLKRRFLK